MVVCVFNPSTKVTEASDLLYMVRPCLGRWGEVDLLVLLAGHSR